MEEVRISGTAKAHRRPLKTGFVFSEVLRGYWVFERLQGWGTEQAEWIFWKFLRLSGPAS